MTAVYILLGMILFLLVANLGITIIVLLGYGDIQPVVLKAMHMKSELIKQQMILLEDKEGQ